MAGMGGSDDTIQVEICNHGRKAPPAKLAFLLPKPRLIIRPKYRETL
jgi:hypothetical protein